MRSIFFHATGQVHTYSIESGELLGSLDIGAGSLAGLAFAPDGTLWFSDAEVSEVLQLRPSSRRAAAPWALGFERGVGSA